MGGAVSTGVDNDDLVDNLLEADYIKTPSVEKVFRSVDRGMYFTVEDRDNAYRDLAWKNGNIHLSAPCIYCLVMESLQLAPGLSFLNLGSGTGYLSTMAGLMLGSFGINHGVEIHQNVVQYAYQKLDDFKKTAPAMDEYDFCEPKFVEGNCLKLSPSSPQYDRVYCGASCPSSYENYMKNLIKVGGILVIPLNDQLLKITRTSESTWDKKFMLAVSFANLLTPSSTSSYSVMLPTTEPISLMDACRSTIRSVLHAAVEHEHPNLKNRIPHRSKNVRQRTLRSLFLPLFGNSESMTIITDVDNRSGSSDNDSDDQESQRERSSSEPSSHDQQSDGGDDASSTNTQGSNEIFRISRYIQVRRGNFSTRFSFFEDEDEDAPASTAGPSRDTSTSSTSLRNSPDTSMDVDETEEPNQGSVSKSKVRKQKSMPSQAVSNKKMRNKRKEPGADEAESVSSNRRVLQFSNASGSNAANEADPQTSEESMDSTEGHCSHPRKEKSVKREKVDSGIGEDISNLILPPPSDMDSDMELEGETDSEEDGRIFMCRPKVRFSQFSLGSDRIRYNRQTTSFSQDSDGGNRVEDAENSKPNSPPYVDNTYVLHMRSKIQQLPLPPSVKSYINYHRDF